MRFNELFIKRYTHLKFTSFPIWFDTNNIKALRLSNLSLIYRVPSSTTTWSPFPQGKADGYRSSLICGMGFNFQLSILSFQFYPCRRHTFPSALGPGPSSLCSLTTVYCGQRPPLSLTHKAKSPPKAEYENVKGEKPWKLFGRNGPLL